MQARHFYQRYFETWPIILYTLLELCGIAGLAVTASDLLSRYLNPLWPTHRAVEMYILVSYLMTLGMFSLCVFVAVDVRKRVWKENDELAQHESARAAALEDLKRHQAQEVLSLRRQLALAEQQIAMARIQHRMAEIVRRHVACSLSKTELPELQKDETLRQVLGSEVPRYLEDRLGKKNISVTVKKYARDAPGDDKKLRAIFRHIGERSHDGQRQDVMEIERSVVFMDFDRSDKRMRRVVIQDTDALDTRPWPDRARGERNEAYVKYARDCGFRSVLAFPLREAAEERLGRMTTAHLIGFVSFDSPDAHAFDGLFTVNPEEQADNAGRNFVDTLELENFFALADNLATLAVLGDAASVDDATLEQY